MIHPRQRLLRELEVSITPLCTLACRECGFLVPDQPAPGGTDPVGELLTSLRLLRDAGVHIGSLAVMGGEPTMNARVLERALVGFRKVGIADRIEVVSNGLTPQGVTVEALANIDRFTISVYAVAKELLVRWQSWIAAVAPHVEVVFRYSESGWDRWTGSHRVSETRAQEMYDHCWYRRHCVTVERGRLFACSRIAKLARDDEGLLLEPTCKLGDIEQYLDRSSALASCADCTPMMGLPTVSPGEQPDDRISRLEVAAIEWLGSAIDRGRGT